MNFIKPEKWAVLGRIRFAEQKIEEHDKWYYDDKHDDKCIRMICVCVRLWKMRKYFDRIKMGYNAIRIASLFLCISFSHKLDLKTMRNKINNKCWHFTPKIFSDFIEKCLVCARTCCDKFCNDGFHSINFLSFVLFVCFQLINDFTFRNLPCTPCSMHIVCIIWRQFFSLNFFPVL